MSGREAGKLIRESERLLAGGDVAGAVASARRAVEGDPESPAAWLAMGNALARMESPAVAEKCFARALSLRPRWAPALCGMGRLRLEEGRADEALPLLREALAAGEKDENGRLLLARALLAIGEAAEAERHYRRLLEGGRSALLLANLGAALHARGEYDQALALTEEALRLEPGSVGAHFNRALLLLLRGDLAAGWREYEWRLQLTPHDRRLTGFFSGIGLPRWSAGSPPRRLLVWTEQGLGDAIQFARYLPRLREGGHEVTLAVQPELERLFARLAGADGIVRRDEETLRRLRVDAQLPLLSLPLELGLERVEPGGAYLAADEAAVERWRLRLGREAPKVGLVWAGGARNPNDRLRSCRLTDLAALAGAGGVRFVSLQKGAPAGQAKSPPAGMELLDPAGELTDLADTAALVAALDLVITVDTAVAHLAGALGRPVWTLLPFDPDWRWGIGRPETPWYPSMRLFRQPRTGDWQTVVAEAAAELKKL